MEELNPPGGLWAGLGMAATGVIAGAIWLFKSISNITVDRAGDHAEINIIEVLQAQNAKLYEQVAAYEAENRDYFQRFMEASTQVSLLTKEVAQLNELMNQMKITNEELKNSIAHLSQELEKRQ